jgi:hypothetical protein
LSEPAATLLQNAWNDSPRVAKSVSEKTCTDSHSE